VIKYPDRTKKRSTLPRPKTNIVHKVESRPPTDIDVVPRCNKQDRQRPQAVELLDPLCFVADFVLIHRSWIPELTFAIEADFFGATGAICITRCCLRARWPACAAFLSSIRRAFVRSIKIDRTMLGTAGIRTFYFAVHQLFVLGGVGKPSRRRSCRCPSPKISNSCEIYQS
jgi:hypothetical protein